jgi:hypothetical protein
MNREMRRKLAKYLRPMTDPTKEAERQERAAAMTKVILNQALADRKKAEQAKEQIKGGDGIISA